MKTQGTRCLMTSLFAGSIIATLITGCAFRKDAVTRAADSETNAPGMSETKDIAEEGFIYGLPLVMNYAIMYQYSVDTNAMEYKGPFNHIKNDSRVFNYKDRDVVTPNSDIPYSLVWLDLRAEPIVLSVPAVAQGRYHSVQLCDGNTFNYGYIGTRATGTQAGDYLVVGPNWRGKTPAGIKRVFRSSTQFSAAIYRTQLFNTNDMPNVVKIQSGYKVQPLSAYLHRPAPPPAPPINFPKINGDMIGTNFFQYLNFVLQFSPPGPEEKDIRAKLARIGIGAGKNFKFDELGLEHNLEVGSGMKDGEAKIKDYLANGMTNVNGWTVASAYGDRNFYHGDWLRRAAADVAGIYGNDAVEAVYPTTKTLANGDTLDGSQHNYTLTFAAGDFPPVNAFWSVTMYNGQTRLLVENQIDRYLINSSMLPDMKRNADGSLTIYIQKYSPGRDMESNWLPAPDGPIYLVMRLYWPKTDAPSILPPGRGTWKPPGIVEVKSDK
jgi:hypothetical protein